MLVGALVPFHDTGGDSDTVREYAQALEAAGYDFLAAPDHVLGANVASRPGWDLDRNTSQDLFHDPFVLLSYVSGVAPKRRGSKAGYTRRRVDAPRLDDGTVIFS
jgi:alkanesulfonate monooxygenase SsuD/methylene tetrahydromethanopterin reductase-like flavin-dependent oxidoreductase (luciferase family)